MSAPALNAFTTWLAAAFSSAETLAIGGQCADGTVFHYGARGEFHTCANDHVWKLIGPTVELLAAAGCGHASVWSFENALLWVALRADGSWLGVFSPRDLTPDQRSRIQAQVDAFAQA